MVVEFKKYILDDVGIRKGVDADYLARWEEIDVVVTSAEISSHGLILRSEEKHFITVITIANQLQIELKQSLLKSFSRDVEILLSKYATALQVIVQNVPNVLIDNLTCLIAGFCKAGLMEETERALQQSPDDIDLQLRHAVITGLHLKVKQASKMLNTILAIHPDFLPALEIRAEFALKLRGAIKLSVQDHERLVELCPNRLKYLFDLGWTYVFSGDNAAVECFKKLSNAQGSTAEDFWYIAKASGKPEYLQQIVEKTEDPKFKRLAQRNADYLIKFNSDPTFRKGEEEKKEQFDKQTKQKDRKETIKWALIILLAIFFI